MHTMYCGWDSSFKVKVNSKLKDGQSFVRSFTSTQATPYQKIDKFYSFINMKRKKIIFAHLCVWRLNQWISKNSDLKNL